MNLKLCEIIFNLILLLKLERMNKLKKLFLITLILAFVLSGCRPIKQEEMNMFRAKQVMASLFTDFETLNKTIETTSEKTEAETETEMEDVVGSEKCERTMLIWESRNHIQDELVEDHQLCRSFVFAWAEGDLKYHILLPGDQDRTLCATLSATNMTAYNISYLLNLPAKLIANIKTDLNMSDASKASKVLSENNLADQIIIKGSTAVFILNDIFTALIGILLALIMLPIGFFIGLIAHPIQTFYDIIPCLLGLVKTIGYAIKHLSY